jgi:predicted unusual protein kinase regulating ubiquinone biosynthesis (AarF/ABC1/UbiB family)
MSNRLRTLRQEIERRLLQEEHELPVGSWGRWTRSAFAGLRGARLAWRHRKNDEETPIDLEALARMTRSVGDLKGIAMKVGQLLSYVDLPVAPEVKAALESLQTVSPPMTFERVIEIIRAELPATGADLIANMEPVPIAAASIGQVHRAQLPDGTRIAVKIQYPEMEKAIAADFGPASAGAHFLRLIAAGANMNVVVKDARAAFLEECDYRIEADHQERFASIYQHHPALRVPAVRREYSSQRVLTTTWVDGARFDAHLASDLSQAERDRVGALLFEFYVGTPYRHRLHNWDPHPGNYLFGSDGGVTMLDYGAVRVLDPEFVRALARLTYAMQEESEERVHEALVALGMAREKGSYDLEVAHRLMRWFYAPMLRDEESVIQPIEARRIRSLISDKRELFKLSLPAELLFVFRTRYGLLSVLSKLGARANWFRMERSLISDLIDAPRAT